MVTVPADTLVTSPKLLIVATNAFDDCQGVPAGVPDPVKVVVNPLQTLSVPLIAGKGFTVTLAV